ncbi:MAG: mevalonate kinase, partial [Bacteroidota bacterium]
FRGEQTEDLGQLKAHLARIEACFHGASSGIDPLICLLQVAILMESKQVLQRVDLPDGQQLGGTIFLLNTHLPRKTAPLVQLFQEKCKSPYYDRRCQSELAPLTDNAIHAFLNPQWSLLFEWIHEIGHFQYRYFIEMIPEAFRPVWLDGLSDDLYKLKLCGAGGGGFILGFTEDWAKTQIALAAYDLIPVFSST